MEIKNNKNKKEIIVIASEEKEISFENPSISSIFGRASYFHLFEKNGELIETIKNPFKIGGGGAGRSVAQMLINKNITKIICGKVGDKVRTVLNEETIEIKEHKK